MKDAFESGKNIKIRYTDTYSDGPKNTWEFYPCVLYCPEKNGTDESIACNGILDIGGLSVGTTTIPYMIGITALWYKDNDTFVLNSQSRYF